MDKLTRYLINANPFMWGVLEAKNKKGRLREIKQLGFLDGYSEGTNRTYNKINRDLLVELGIKGILRRIIVPKIINGFTTDVLSYLQRCWEQGHTPDIKYLIENQLYHSHRGDMKTPHKDSAHFFFQIDTKHEFIERWTVFAGLWFEEISPLSKKA